jgi:hypothetical protein
VEVHHHPKAIGLHSSRKKWTHYFWEFLMLFLAVFCGFLAEYQLEHKIEKDRAQQYMQSMIQDLKSDSAMLAENVSGRTERIQMIDSLVVLLNNPQMKDKLNDAYYYARSISPPLNIFPNDRTIQQLKSSGNLRLIRKQSISNAIMDYDQKMRHTLFEMGDEIEIRAEYRTLAKKIFDTKIFHAMIAGSNIKRPVENPPLFNADPSLLNEYIGAVQYAKRVHQAQLNRSKQLLEQSRELMLQVRLVYRINN